MIYPNGGLPEKFQRRRKQFVEVVAEHKLDGTTLPKTIILADGRHFEVEIQSPFYPVFFAFVYVFCEKHLCRMILSILKQL